MRCVTVALLALALTAARPANSSPDSATSLADAIAALNTAAADDAVGRDQPPLTEDEVVAAIRAYRPEKGDDHGQDLRPTYRRIAETRELPPKAAFETMTQWEPDEHFAYDVWWVRLRLERANGESYAFPIRSRMIRSYPLDPKDLAFGPPGAKGLRVACYLAPAKDSYAFDDVVYRFLVFRNDGDAPLDLQPPEEPQCDDVWTVTDDAGKPIATSTQQWREPHLHTTVPTVTLKRGETYRVACRRSVGLGHGAPVTGPGTTIVQADMGQTCHATWSTRCSIIGVGAVTLTSGELTFRIEGGN